LVKLNFRLLTRFSWLTFIATDVFMGFSYVKKTGEAMPTGEWNPRWVQSITSDLRLKLQTVNSVCIGLKQQGRPLEVQTRNG
jgi:hypothetical protein